MIHIIYLILNFNLWASEPPCSEFETKIKATSVKAFIKKDGTQVSNANRKEHCREVYPNTKNWINSFKDTRLQDWQRDEEFKAWKKSEKEIVLKIISAWPDAFIESPDIKIYRARKSLLPRNPGSSLPKEKSIILYDLFFNSKNQDAILSHEMAHIFILQSSATKIKEILLESGWEKIKNGNGMTWSGKKLPLKNDSIDNPSEDLANHIEDFLHSPDQLEKDRPLIYKMFSELLGPNFQIRKQK